MKGINCRKGWEMEIHINVQLEASWKEDHMLNQFL
jgi:hypothetical protein